MASRILRMRPTQLSALFLTVLISGCGSVSDVDEDLDAASTAGDATAPGEDASAEGADASAPGFDAALPDAGPQPLEPQCEVEDALGSAVCLETATAAPGETVAIEVHLIPQQGCTELDQSHTNILYDEDVFTYVEPDDGDDCLMQDEREDPIHIYWHAFTEAAVGDVCPASLEPGHVDTVHFEIANDTPEGDYDLELENVFISATEEEPNCGGSGSIDGIVRVAP